MCMSNKEMDRAVELAEEENDYAVAHSSDNSPNYVANRYAQLHLAYHVRVPVRAGAALPADARLFPAGPEHQRKGVLIARSGPARAGIVVALFDAASGETSDYQVESNGLNGVEVTRRA